MLRRHHHLDSVLLFLAMVMLAGCKSTSVPSGMGWKSIAATRTMGAAMRDACANMDMSFADGRSIVVRSKGFEKDEVGSYLRLITEEAAFEAGGVVQQDGELIAEVHVHLSGMEKISRYLIPLFETTQLIARLNAELVVRDRSGKLISRQELESGAMYQESVFLVLFTTPGAYYLMRDQAWERVEGGVWFTDELYMLTKRHLDKKSSSKED